MKQVNTQPFLPIILPPKVKVCAWLEKKGINPINLFSGVEECQHCPYPKCIVKDKEDDLTPPKLRPRAIDVSCHCTNCHAMETVTLFNGQLTPTMKYVQIGYDIFHIHGTLQSYSSLNIALCKLYL